MNSSSGIMPSFFIYSKENLNHRTAKKKKKKKKIAKICQMIYPC